MKINRSSTKVVSEMVRKFSESILREKDFGMDPGELYEIVARKVLKETRGYPLGDSHFMLSLMNAGKDEMFTYCHPFVVSSHGAKVKIFHKKKFLLFEKALERIIKTAV